MPLIPTGLITLVILSVILLIGIKSCMLNYKLVALSFIISLIGARLASANYALEWHIYAMVISMTMLIGFKEYRLIAIGYIPRITIALIGVNNHNDYMPTVFLLSEFFLIIQLLLWVSLLRNDDGGGRSNYYKSDYHLLLTTVLARCRALAFIVRKEDKTPIQKEGLK